MYMYSLKKTNISPWKEILEEDTKGTEWNSLELFVQREGDLWGHVDEALTQQQPHGLGGVTEDLL